jgi:N-methylhydantoinase A
VIIPRGAGVGSALGLLAAKQKIDVAMTHVLRLDGHAQGALASTFAELEARARNQVAQLTSTGNVLIERGASMHHAGQGYQIRVDLPAGEIGSDYEDAVKAAFYAAYKREYGYNDTESAIEVTDWYVQATVDVQRESVNIRLHTPSADGNPVTGERLAYFPESGGMVPAKVVNRYALKVGQHISGPALVEERESTTVVLPGDTLYLTACDNLLIEIGKV